MEKILGAMVQNTMSSSISMYTVDISWFILLTVAPHFCGESACGKKELKSSLWARLILHSFLFCSDSIYYILSPLEQHMLIWLIAFITSLISKLVTEYAEWVPSCWGELGVFRKVLVIKPSLLFQSMETKGRAEPLCSSTCWQKTAVGRHELTPGQISVPAPLLCAPLQEKKTQWLESQLFCES